MEITIMGPIGTTTRIHPSFLASQVKCFEAESLFYLHRLTGDEKCAEC